MLFEEAKKALKEGKFVARSTWDNEGKYLVFMPGMLYIWQIMTQPNPNAGNYPFSIADFDADDWKIVDAVKEKVQEAA